jgi:hypothetical protein
VPNIIGLYMLAPLVKRELNKYNSKYIPEKWQLRCDNRIKAVILSY